MEGEQKVDLPLDGELDIKSSDMLVPVSQAKFAHNRQRWQGHVLPSSLRYEHDGWAAGWDVYDIKYDEQSYTAEDHQGIVYKVRRHYYNDNRAYKIVIYSADDKYIGSFIYNVGTVTNSDNVQVTRVVNMDTSYLTTLGSVYNIAFDLNGKRVTCAYDLVTGAITCDDNTIAVSASISDNAKLRINAEDTTAAINVSIDKFNIPNAMYAIIGSDETVLGQFTMYDGSDYTWRNNTYDIVLYNNNVISIRKGDTVLHSTTVTITDGIISPFDFSIVATADAEYTAARSAVQVANVNNVQDTSAGNDIWLGNYSDGKRTFLYKYGDSSYTTSYFVNKLNFASSAVAAEKPSTGMRMFIPVHVTAVYNRDTNGNVSVKVFENDVDCTFKYSITINGFGFSIRPKDNANAFAKICTPDNTDFLYLDSIVASDIVNAGKLDTTNYKHTTVNGTDIYKYTAIRNTAAFDSSDNGSYILPYDEIVGKTRYITSGIGYNAGYRRVSPRTPFINIFCDSTVTVQNSNVTANIIIDVIFYATATATIDKVDDTISLYNSTSSLDLCSEDQALFSYSISDVSGIPDNGNNMFSYNIAYKYSIRPRNTSTLFFVVYPHGTAPDAYTAYTPNAYAVYDSAVTDGKNIVAVPVTPEITNKKEPDGTIPESYVPHYDLLDISAYATCNCVRYIDSMRLSYTADDTTTEDLSAILSSTHFLLDKPKVISGTSYTQDIRVQIPGIGIYGPFTINGTPASVQMPVIQLDSVPYKGSLFTLKFNTAAFNSATVTVTANTVKLVTNFSVLATAVPYASNGYTIVSADGSIIEFSDTANNVFKYSYISGSIEYKGEQITDAKFIQSADNYYTMQMQFNYVATRAATCILEGPVLQDNVSITEYYTEVTPLSKRERSFIYMNVTDDSTIQLDMRELMSLPESSAIVTATDIRDPELHTNDIQKIASDNTFQIIKQQWNTTTEVEKFWWLDSDHILVLDKVNLTVLTKQDTVDDWNGDKWQKEKIYSRIDFIDDSVCVYSCSSAYNTSAVFYTIKVINDRQALVRIFNLLSSRNATEVIIDIKHVPLGDKLNPISAIGSSSVTSSNVLYTYADITMAQLLASATITATRKKNKVILGIHYDNNFNQWALVIASTVLGSTVRCIQGYGYVGVDGSLTGGEIPYKYFALDTASGADGFSGTVEDIQSLKKKDGTKDKDYVRSAVELLSVSEHVVGNDTQQWYISKNVDSIVSHITCDDDCNFTAQRLYLNNNYNAVYASGSFAAQVMGDSETVSVDNLYNLLGSNIGMDYLKTSFEASNNITGSDTGAVSAGDSNKDAWSKFTRKFNGTRISAFTDFNIYTYSPIVSCINYIQQTIGQYAYVHYNSSNIIQSRDIISDAESIMSGENIERYTNNEDNVKAIRNSFDSGVSPISSDEIAFDTQVVRQAQSCSSTWPTSFVMILSIAMSALDVVTDKLKINSASNQMSLAGKGTSTQLLSQALNSLALSDLQAQQIVPTQMSEVPAIKTLDMFYSTSEGQKIYAGPGFVNHNFVAQCTAQSVTSIQLELNQQKLQWIIKAITEAAQIALTSILHMVADNLRTSISSIFSFHYAVGAFVVAASAGVSIAAAIAESKLKLMDTMLNALGADHAQLTTLATLSKHAYDVEGKHKYGNSSKSFMWPCFGCDNESVYTDEYVDATAQNKSWYLHTPTSKNNDINVIAQVEPNADSNTIASFVTSAPANNVVRKFEGNIDYYIAMCKGNTYVRNTPKDMACIIGTETFLSKDNFKNDAISEDAPVFSAPLTQDYMISGPWELGVTATAGGINWVSVRDTKIIDGEPSNIVIGTNFCGVASSYTAIEVKRGISKKYMRPVTITPTALALNCTGYNCVFDSKAYHGFDGYGSRIVQWTGAPGMSKEKYTLLYSFLINDRFKRSNKIAPNQLLGNFNSDPSIAATVIGTDKLHIQVMVPSDNKNIFAGVPGEDKDVQRYALPVFSEYVNTLPAAVKTLSTYVLATVEGITSLCTDIRNAQVSYKAPVSVDFTISENVYRVTQEYICRLTNKKGVVIVDNLVPILGLDYIGASPYEAYFYSQATRQYYIFTGGTELKAVDTVERFRDVKNGYWDFVNQEVVMPCVATFDRLDSKVRDDYDDETDNIIIPVIKSGAYRGEVPPPIPTIFNTESWFKTYSLPSGVVFQGPNRCIINRFVWSDYMLPSVLDNRGKWKKVPREDYHPFREYEHTFIDVQHALEDGVTGWTHNPFLLVTSPLGVNEETDCKFEWEITFAWTVEMEKLYSEDNYACVNVIAETMEPGGKVYSRPTHIYLTKDLFTRTGNYGYYSFRYQSNNGIGNRERLHIWADSYIAVSSVQCAYVEKTTRRTEILTQQVDIKGLKEM